MCIVTHPVPPDFRPATPVCQCLWRLCNQAIDTLLQGDERYQTRQQAQQATLVRPPCPGQFRWVSLLKNGQHLQPQIAQMVEPAFPHTKCRRHDTLDETSAVQNLHMPIHGGTTATCCKGKVLRSLQRITQQPLE